MSRSCVPTTMPSKYAWAIIEWIVVMTRRPSGVLRMASGDRENLEPEREYRRDDRSIEAERPDRPLDGNLPHRRVDLQPHDSYSKYFCSSGGRGPSKSSAM